MSQIIEFAPFCMLSKIYDTLTYDINYARWVNYLISFLNSTNKKILEYACGTGNITQYLINHFNDITSVDISSNMLEVAEQKLRNLNPKVRLVCADMVNFELNTPVNTAICALDGVNYILTYKDLLEFFKNVYKNITRNGIFLFDISSRYKIKNILGNSQYFDDSNEQTLLWQNDFDSNTSIVTMNLTLFINFNDCYKRYDETHFQRAWYTQEIQDALSEANFSDINIYKFGTFDKIRENDDRIQFVAIKGEKI